MADPIIIGKYRIEGKIGAGGMGAVYEAVHVDLGKCALKQLKHEFAGRADVVKRFRREARDMFRLKHSHIVRVFDYGVEDGFGAYLVMDLVEGADLGHIIFPEGPGAKGRPLPLVEVVRIGSEVASALDYAHAQGLVHRDIKPGNILIEDTTKRALVTDFGIAKHTEQRDDEITTDALTQTTGFVGTSRYSSPEQLRSEDLDARADIYSLGAVLYEMCSGRRYLEDLSQNQIIIRVGGFSEWKPDLPYPETVTPALIELIEACLERDRDKRITRAGEVVERLRRCADASASAMPPAVEPATPRPPPRPIPEEPTQPTAIEGFETIRANLRRELDAAVEGIAELDRAANAIGVDAPDGPRAEALRARLDEVAAVEERGAYAQAVRSLEELTEYAAQQHDAIAEQLRAGVDAARGELADSWQDLTTRASGFVGQTQNDRFEQLLGYVVERVREDDWERVSIGLAQARQVRGDAEVDARRRAEQAIQTALAGIGEKARQLHAVGALPPDFDVAAAEARIAAALAGGLFAQARVDADAATESLDAALDEWRRREGERARVARDTLAAFLREVSFEAVPQAAAELVRRGQQSAAVAEKAMTANDSSAAADAYTAALESYRAAAERARLDTFAAQVEAQRDVLTRVEELERRAGDAGVELPAGADPALLRQVLQELEEARETLAPADAAARLAAVGERIQEHRARREADLGGALSGEMKQAAARWEQLEEAAGQFVNPARHESIGRLLDSARSQLSELAPEECLRLSAVIRDELLAAETAAAAAAGDEVERRLGLAQQLHAEIAAIDRAAVPADVEPEELRASARNLLENGRLAAADELAVTALDKLTAARAELRRLDAEAAAAAHAALQATVDGLDLDAAAQVAAAEMDAAAAARAGADAASAQGEHRAATAAYDQARQAYDAVGERIDSARRAAMDELRNAADGARAQPEAVLGEALRHADGLLGGNPRLQALLDATAAIDAAVERVAAYQTASERQQACAAAERSILERPETVRSRRKIRRRLKSAKALQQQADDFFSRQQWAEAADGFVAATAALSELDQEILRLQQQPPSQSPVKQIAAGAGVLALAALALWLIPQWMTDEEEKVVPRPPIGQPQPAEPEAAPLQYAFAAPHPGGADVAVAEGKTQRFAVAVEGGPPGVAADTRWLLDGEQVAANVDEWTYTPDYDAGRAEPYVVRVQVGQGDDAPAREWKVRVDDVNRIPVVATAEPDPGKVEQAVGKTVSFRADASDADEDELRYAWTVDGKSVGTSAPELDWKVAGDHQVEVAVSDGKVDEPVTVKWEVAAIAPAALPPLTMRAEPATLSSLRFRTAQEFRLSPPADAKGLQYDWRLDGKPAGSAARYVFANSDAALVRAKPVEVAVAAVDDRNRKFTKVWTFKIQPPAAPRIAGSKPSSPIAGKVDAPIELSLTPGSAVNGQTLSYLFSVDGGREQRSTSPAFRFTPKKEEHSVVARAVDNFGQSSDRVTWRVRSASIAPPAPPEAPPAAAVASTAAVRAWLEGYRKAFMQKDIDALKGMMKLSDDKAETLRTQLAMQRDLEVAFSNIDVEALGDGRFRASYSRKDSFTNPQTGRSVSPAPVRVQQEFRSVDGRIQLVK